MNTRFIAIGMLCLSLLLVPLGQASAAVANPSNGQTYETILSSTDTALSGVMTSKQFNVQKEDYWNVSNVVLNLDYQATPLVWGDRSSVTLMVNGTKFYSFRPSAESVQQHLKIAVPKNLLIDGNNTISIEGYIQTTIEDQVCVPLERRDNWLQLYKTSSVVMSYTNEARDGSISDFNERFIGLDTVSGGLNAIAVPQKSSTAELEASVYALSGFAKANPIKSQSIPMISYDEARLQSKKTVVAVALWDQLPAELKSQLGAQDLGNKALIQVVNTDIQPTLVITSQDPKLLVKAGRLVANQELVGQLNSNQKIVDANTNVETPVVSVSKDIMLTDTGDQLKGVNHQEKTYFISLPANRSIADASKISLDMRYATNLDFDRSMVTVLLNNTPIGSKKLTSELANGDTITLPIPTNVDITGNFSVTVAFDLELKNVGCIRLQDQMPWAFITKDSELKLNTKDKMDLLFNNYPNPYLRDGSFNQIAVVLPQELDHYTLLTISNVFNMLGQYAEGNTGDIKFYADTIEAAELKNHNVIAIGTYQNNKVIQAKNDKLYFQYGTDGKGLVSNEKMSIEEEYGKRIGSLQLIDSPYESGHGFLAVTGASSEYIYLASKLISSDSTKWKVFGDGVITDKDGNVNAFRFKKQVEADQSSVISDVIQRSDVLGFMVAIGLILLLILISLVLIIRKYRKKRGESDET